MIRPKIAETVPKKDWDLLTKIQAIIEGLPPLIETPAFIFGIRMPRSTAVSHSIPSCHVVTRALSKFLPVDIHDGYIRELRYGGEEKWHEHSWLTRKGGNGKVIIDPWPLGVVTGPALFVQDYCFHFGNDCTFLHTRTKEFVVQVAALRLEIRKVIKRQKIPLRAAS